MAKDKKDNKTVKVINKNGPVGFAYFLTVIGAAVYFVQHSAGFWGFILAILKAFVWPAFVMHQTLVLMNI
jgi:hypothetical protein